MRSHEFPRIFVIGTSVLMPNKSQNVFINRPSQLADIVFSGQSTIGILPPTRRLDESIFEKFPEFRNGMVGNFFDCGSDPDRFRDMLASQIPNIPGWEPNIKKGIKTPQEAMAVALNLNALKSADITPDRFTTPTSWIPKGDNRSKRLRVAIGATSTLGPYHIYSQIGREGITPKRAMGAARGGIAADAHTAVIEPLGTQGPSNPIQAACATGLFQVDTASMQMLLDRTELAIPAAFEIGPDINFHDILFGSGAYVPFDKYGNQPENACRPGDRNPAGMVTGEGGVALVLATEETIHRLGLPPECRLIEIKATAIGQDPNRLAPQDEPRELPRVLNEVLERAEMKFSDLDLVIPHDTGTMGTIHDYKTLRQIAGLPPREFTDPPDSFHSGLPYVTSPKSNFGHLLAASGLASMLIGIESIKRRKIPATRNIDKPHGMVFNPVYGQFINADVKNVLVFAEGIAGETVAVIFSRV